MVSAGVSLQLFECGPQHVLGAVGATGLGVCPSGEFSQVRLDLVRCVALGDEVEVGWWRGVGGAGTSAQQYVRIQARAKRYLRR